MQRRIRPLGFADLRQTAEFFGLSQEEVRQRAESGKWPSYCIGNRRCFDLDELVDTIRQQADREAVV